MWRTLFICLCSNLFGLLPLFAEDRSPAVAGQFYPANTTDLAQEVTQLLRKAPARAPADIVALIAPHAGYPYSGSIAAHAFKQIEKSTYDVIVLVGKSHHEGFDFAAVWPYGAFYTPLGKVPVSSLAYALVATSPLFKAYLDPHIPEHSLEVMLPFIQHVIPHTPIIPILLGNDNAEMITTMSAVLTKVLKNKKVLIIASTDLSHYPQYADACRIDSTTLHSWQSMDPTHIRQVEKQLMDEKVVGVGCTMCGNAAVYLTMLTAQKRGAQNIRILAYANSGDITKKRENIVGYAAAMIYR